MIKKKPVLSWQDKAEHLNLEVWREGQNRFQIN